MLTKSEEGEVDMITSAESVNLDSTGEKGYTLGNNIIYFDYDKYSVKKKEDKAIIKKYSNYKHYKIDISNQNETVKNYIKAQESFNKKNAIIIPKGTSN